MNITAMPRTAPRPSPSKVLDELRLGTNHPKIDVHLNGDEYRAIALKDAAKMLGYFSQKMQDQGFPWKLKVAVDQGDDNFRAGADVSDLDALKQLQQGKPVMFQPMRNLQLDLSSDSLGALAAAGALGTGTEIAGMARLAAISKTTRVTPGSQGIELKYGEPVVVSNFSELKLLYQMYNPDEKVTSKNEVAKAANQLSYFTQKTASGQYPWRFYKESDTNTAGRVATAVARSAVKGGAMGAGVGALVGAPLAFFARDWSFVLGAVGVGAAGFALYSAQQAARTAAKGEGVNAVEALERVLNGQEVVLQETEIRSVGVPIFGKISWFSDHGPGSKISSTSELDTFYWMQNQDAKEEPKPEVKPAIPSVLVIHQHYGDEVNINR